MEYFSIEDPQQVVNNIAPGFQESSFLPQCVDDNQISIPVEKINKMGSSIPTVYARLFLYSSAFKQVNKFENDHVRSGHNGVNDQNGNIVPSSYHYLVSECLDLLEFIYIYSSSENFGIIDYNIANETRNLQNDGMLEHKRLAKALLDFKKKRLESMTDIYLFTWKGNIIGGTSPFTLVYTSPNIRKLGLNEQGGAGNNLFGDTSTPLCRRSEGFRKFMYNYIFVMNLGPTYSDLENYVLASLSNYDKEWENDIKESPNLTGCRTLNYADRAIDLDGRGTHLYSDFKPLNLEECGYIIKPSVGKVANMAPLVLNENGLDDVEYVNGRTWKYGEDLLPEIKEDDFNKRHLPSTAYMYPYLTIDDFVEDKIIETSYKLRSSKFVLGLIGGNEAHYLLPLKKTFFDYFAVSDINKIVTFDNEQEDQVTVELNIPIKAGHIVLKKTYVDENIISGYEQKNVFNIAIFPFYKVLPVKDIDNNQYEVMLGSRGKDINIKFYKEDGSVVETNGVKRSQGDDETVFYNVDGCFDRIELQIASTTGVIVPNWHIIEMANANSDFYFCMDFGTTNTHITYATVNAANGIVKIPASSVRAFDITQSDNQVATLDDNDSGEFMNFPTKIRQEFVPYEIGEKLAFKFPMRTSTCQVNRKVANLEMFSNMNIGFYYDHDISVVGDGQQYFYNTNIKWNRRDVHSSDRMAEFFKQALWMMKNKALLNGGSDQIHLTYTYPQSMSDGEVDRLGKAWKNAAQYLHIDTGNINSMYEGVAPYYSFLKGMTFGAAYMNLDIGGGTTDIFYRNPVSHEDFSLSAFFAANDLWGDGANPDSPIKSNGLLQAYKQSPQYDALSDEDKILVDTVLDENNNNVTSSADAICYLFSHDKTTRFSDFVSNDSRMVQLPIAHFASIVYYAAWVIDRFDIDVPTTMSFTGMGSLYIKIISGRPESMAKLVEAIFHYCGIVFDNDSLKNCKVNVIFADNPKVVTAEGGLIQNTKSEKIVPESVLCYGYEGEETKSILRYRDIGAKKEAVMKEYAHFIKMFEDDNFKDTVDYINSDVDIQQVANYLKRYKDESYSVMAAQNDNDALKNKKLKEPLFFWCIKDALYHAGVELSKQGNV